MGTLLVTCVRLLGRNIQREPARDCRTRKGLEADLAKLVEAL
jgi:hypothetical protein